MPPLDINDTHHWRDCASELRALADELENTDGKAILHRLAVDYDWLADWAAHRRDDAVK
jgi:hypothetical protein